MRLSVTVDSHLALPDYALDYHELVEQIFDELTIENPEHEYAKRTERWGWWEIPEAYELYDVQGDNIILPRGYALRLKQVLREHGHEVRWRYNWKWKKGEPYGRDEFSYRPHQPRAVRQLNRHVQGIYKAPTGSGKTVTFCGWLWEHHPDLCVILVDKVSLVEQWRDRILEHIGPDVPVGTVAGGNVRIDGARIVVATFQACHRAIEQDKDWIFDLIEEASALFVDECHHAPAETYRNVVDRFVARVREGTTATPGKCKIPAIMEAVLGPVIYEDSEEELVEMGVIQVPHVEVVDTSFYFDYWPSHKATKDDEYVCMKPGCKKSGIEPHGHRDNYQDLKTALVHDEDRNRLIAQRVMEVAEEGKHHQLIVTSEVQHINAMLEHFDTDIPIYVLKGGSKKKQQDTIKAVEAADESIMLSTIAGEGLDIPKLDRVWLVFPTSNARSTEQQIGRGRRTAEGKGDSIIFDVADREVPHLAKQFRKRRYGCYDKLGLEVVM